MKTSTYTTEPDVELVTVDDNHVYVREVSVGPMDMREDEKLESRMDVEDVTKEQRDSLRKYILTTSWSLEALSRLETVLARLCKLNLKIKPEKFKLFKERVCYLGHVVTKEGTSPDPDKVRAVTDWPRHLQTTAKLGATEMRWAAELAQFNFNIKYRSGRSNGNADALSRKVSNG
ncbi:Retrovirus-related Pol polyprotein from transposon gypsy [Exaiptasia diaphana]|nr:Retrovirus-related Pol polyprotein from transposon gypsy [Exaiptasia diaphana]